MTPLESRAFDILRRSPRDGGRPLNLLQKTVELLDNAIEMLFGTPGIEVTGKGCVERFALEKLRGDMAALASELRDSDGRYVALLAAAKEFVETQPTGCTCPHCKPPMQRLISAIAKAEGRS